MAILKATITRISPDLHITATLEEQLPEGVSGGAITECFEDTFRVLQSTVEGQIPQATAQRQTRPAFQGNTNQNQQQSQAGTSNIASKKQLNFLFSLGHEMGLDLNELNQLAHGKFGVQSVHELTKRQMSVLLDDLQMQRQRGAA